MSSTRGKRTLLASVKFFMRVFHWIGYVTLSGMILVTTTNVFGRYILKRPLLGEVDMVELGMAILGGFAMFFAATQRHHVSVDVLLIHFPRRTRVIFGRIALLLGFMTWALLAYRAFLNGLGNLESGSRTATLFVPQGPFEITLAIGIFLFSLTLLIQVFLPEEAKEMEGEGPRL